MALADVCVVSAEAGEHGLDDLLVAVAGEDAWAVFKRGGGEAEEGSGDKGEGVGCAGGGGADEDGRNGGGGEGEGLAGGFDEEGGGFADELDFAGFEDFAVLVAEDRDQDLVAETGFLGVPLDVEEGGVAGAGAVFEDVPPEAVFGADGHVVGDDVKDLAEVIFAQGLAEGFVGFVAA